MTCKRRYRHPKPKRRQSPKGRSGRAAIGRTSRRHRDDTLKRAHAPRGWLGRAVSLTTVQIDAHFSVSRRPEDPAPAPGGGVKFGEITDAESRVMHRQAGEIRLPLGAQHADGTGLGRTHIEANHGKQLARAGFDSVDAFVQRVSQHFDTAWSVPS